MAFIQFDGITKRFPGVLALDQVILRATRVSLHFFGFGCHIASRSLQDRRDVR